jgi:hypothetical protein
MRSGITKHPACPYVAPFAVYVVLLALEQHLHLSGYWYVARVLAASAVVVLLSRHVVSFKPSHAARSMLLGAGVFVLWIGPDLLFPGYRDHWLFVNSLTGAAQTSLSHPLRTNAVFLLFRLGGSVILVPVVEELFWRAWLMRYLIARDFCGVPLGSWTPQAFWISAILFASEHGPYWDVGLAAGVAYNWWIVRTRSLADCILAHAVTNACLAVYVLCAGKWEYWL